MTESSDIETGQMLSEGDIEQLLQQFCNEIENIYSSAIKNKYPHAVIIDMLSCMIKRPNYQALPMYPRAFLRGYFAAKHNGLLQDHVEWILESQAMLFTIDDLKRFIEEGNRDAVADLVLNGKSYFAWSGEPKKMFSESKDSLADILEKVSKD